MNLDNNQVGFHNEISWENLNKIDNVNKKITDFCGHFIYGEKSNNPGICNRPECKYIHSRDITKMQHYLQNNKVKSFDCMKAHNCNFYVCLFRHPADQYLLYKSKIGENTMKPIKLCSDIDRKLAANNHKIQYFKKN